MLELDCEEEELDEEDEDEDWDSATKSAVTVPGAVTVAVVPLDCAFVMVIPVVALHDEKR